MDEPAKNPIDTILAEPDEDIIGRVLTQAPDFVTDSALDALIAKLRQDRALFIKNEFTKGDKADGTPTNKPTPDQDGAEDSPLG